jgi:hypothetical protein
MSVKFVVGGLLGFIGGGIASFFVTKRLLEVETDRKIKEEIDAYHQFVQEKVIKADNINEHDNRVKNSFLDEIMNKTERLDMGYRTEVREFLDGFYIEEDKGEVDNNNKEDFSRTFKIRFFNELNEEIFYLNFGNNDEFYSYYDTMRGYAILVAHLNCNNIEYELIDETYFR